MRTRIGFSSVLASDYQEDLEKLLFFNPQQSQTLPYIRRLIPTVRRPSIYTQDGRLRIRIEDLPRTPDPSLPWRIRISRRSGRVMVFCRVNLDTVVLVHIAVLEEYSRFGARADAGLVAKMISELRAVARKLKGVRSIELKYAKGLVFPV